MWLGLAGLDMRIINKLFLAISFLFLATPALALVTEVCEDDGTDCKYPYSIRFPVGNITDNGDGTLNIADDTGAGGGDEIAVNSSDATNANFLDNIYIDWALNTGSSPDDITSKFNYNAASGDVALSANEVAWSLNGLVSEGATANTIEGRFVFPDWATSDKDITFQDATHTVVGRDTTDTLTNKTLAAADNVIGADTAVALAANGANASSGNAILGVDASGAAEGAFDVWTEAENTAAAYLDQSEADLLYQPLDAQLTDLADGTLTGDFVNTANPWADNEVADNITAGNVEGTDFGTLTDTKICVYDLAGTEIDCTSDAGSGDVTDAGDCTGGACGDGTSDGGTYYRLYDGDSHYGQYDAVDLDANRTWSGPNATGTVVLEDNTATLTNKTLAAANNVIEADTGDSATSFFSAGTIEAARLPDADDDASTKGIATWADADIDCTTGSCSVAAAITRDAEWDTEGEVQTAWGGVNILLETEIDASSELLALMDDETGTGLLVFNNSPLFADDFDLASAGVRMSGANGVLTILGLGDGADENLLIDFNTTANSIDLSSGTSATEFNLGTLDLNTDTIDLTGTGTLNGLDAIDGTSETTLEGAIDIAGEVTGTGLGSVTIADSVSVATWTMTGSPGLTLSNGATSAGVLQISEDSDNGTNYTRFTVGAQAADITYTLPTDDGDADQVLSTNGSGVLDWVTAAGSGDITDVYNCSNGDCNSIVMADGDLLNGSSVSVTSTTEGIILPQHATDCSSSGTAEGQVCWEADANTLWVGNGTTVTQIGAGGGPSYWQLQLLPESAVLDDNSSPAVTTIESSGTGTPRFRVADFDASTDEIIYWTFVVQSDMAAGDWLADVSWYTNDTGAGETAYWESAISCTTEGDADTMAEQANGTTNTANEDANTTEANRLITTTITMSNLDSVAAGDVCTLRFNRDANNASDDLTSDARLVAVRLRIPRA